jgi:hypothetical protein
MGALREKFKKRGIECPSTFRLMHAAVLNSNTTFKRYLPCKYSVTEFSVIGLITRNMADSGVENIQITGAPL